MNITFTRNHPGDPLFILNQRFESDMGTYTIAFMPSPESVIPKQSLTLPETWREFPGVYLFLGSLPVGLEQFAHVLTDYLLDPSYPGVRFLWIANPDEPQARWQTCSLSLAPPQEGVPVTNRVGVFGFRNITLFVGAGCVVALNAGEDGFLITPPTGTPGRIYLTVQAGAAKLDNISSPLTISFLNNQAGCLRFMLNLDNSGADPDFNRLDVGCRYFTEDDGFPGYGRLKSWRYPVFDPESAAIITMDTILDPLNPLQGGRTYLGFPHEAGAAPTIRTFFVTNTGYPLSLTPAPPGDSNLPPRLVFLVRTLADPPRETDPYYLAPAGEFAISFPGGQEPVRNLMCGISGVEYLALPFDKQWVMNFVPGQPACAAHNDAATTAGLSATAQTSWIYLTTPVDPGAAYFAQPGHSPLYRLDPDTPFLRYMEICSGILPPQAPVVDLQPASFPMAAFAGVETADSVGCRQLELKIISPERRRILYGLLRPSPASPQGKAITPSGLLASWDRGLSLLFGQTGQGTHQLRLDRVNDGLLNVFLSDQLFLVISNKKKLLQYAAIGGSILTIHTGGTDGKTDSWTFDIFGVQGSIDGWEEHQTVFIFKFSGKSILELAGDTATWTQGSAFNDSLPDTRERLLGIITDAQSRLKNGESEFDNFVNKVVSNPSWNGILALQCTVPMDELPDQISGVAAGIDPAKFYAHHLGITTTPVNNVNEHLELGDSSLFGLIYYSNLTEQNDAGTPYRFKVLSLKILFSSSAIQSFSSSVELLVNELFGEKVELLEGPHGNNLILNGVYQTHDGQSSYMFLSQAETVFQVDSAVLDSVNVTKAQFVMAVPSGNTEDKDGKVEACFQFWGSMSFKVLTGFDLFSYGSPGRLSFSNLAVRMTYSAQAPLDQSFVFDAGRIEFDMAQTASRPGSLFNRFPLKLSGFVQGTDKENTPASMGYAGVDAPIGQGTLASSWFGLVAELNLGTPGALAAAAGFTASLLAAWSPGAKSPNVFIGLKLPGMGGGEKTLSLEGILKLKVKRIAFMVDDSGAYLLKLDNIALSLLGLTIPPSGQTGLFLFGDPAGKDNTTLGWYGGYAKQKEKKRISRERDVKLLNMGD